MNLTDASKILGIDNLMSCETNELKRLYKKLMRKHHPDVGGDTEKAQLIIEAYNYTIKLKEEAVKYQTVNAVVKVPTVVLGFDDLLGILRGGVIKISDSGDFSVIRKDTIGRFNIIVMFRMTMLVDGNPVTVERYVTRDALDNYLVQCRAVVESTSIESTVEVYLGGKKLSLKATGSRCDFVINYDNLAKVRLSLERCVLK